jgi:hypothetical protein
MIEKSREQLEESLVLLKVPLFLKLFFITNLNETPAHRRCGLIIHLLRHAKQSPIDSPSFLLADSFFYDFS